MSHEILLKVLDPITVNTVMGLPVTTRKPLIECIVEYIEKGHTADQINPIIIGWITADLNTNATVERMTHNENISKGIEYISKNGGWSDLKNVASHALQAALTVCKESERQIEKDMVDIFQAKLNLLNSSINEYSSVIEDLKTIMHGQASKWITNVLKEHESDGAGTWKEWAVDLIKKLFDMDGYFEFEFENKHILYINKADGNFAGGIGYCQYVEVCFGSYDGFEEDENPGYHATNGQYFHVDDVNYAIECFMERVLSAEPFTATLTGNTLMEIKEKHGWTK